MENNKVINVEVAYALSERQQFIKLQVEKGTTVQQAVRLSGIEQMFPEVDLQKLSVGIFGKIVTGELYGLREGDRVEIYRPLIADPKEARKQRAEMAKRGEGK